MKELMLRLAVLLRRLVVTPQVSAVRWQPTIVMLAILHLRYIWSFISQLAHETVCSSFDLKAE